MLLFVFVSPSTGSMVTFRIVRVAKAGVPRSAIWNVTDFVSPGLIDWIVCVAGQRVGRLLDRQRDLDLRLLAVAGVLDEHLEGEIVGGRDRVLLGLRLERRVARLDAHAGDPVAAQAAAALARRPA